MNIYHFVTIDGGLSSFEQTTFVKAKLKEVELEKSFRALPGELEEKGVFIYYYDDYFEEERGHIVAETQQEAKIMLKTINH